MYTCVRACVNLCMYVHAYLNCVQEIYVYVRHTVGQLVEAVRSNPEGRRFIGSFL